MSTLNTLVFSTMTKGMHPRQPQPQPLQQQQQQQQPQRTSPQPRRSKQSKQKSHLPGAAPYLRILFPRHVQLREPVPQLLNHPHPDLDAEAYHFLALLVRDFIQTWYTTFSNDPQFVASIVHVVIDIARKLERRSQEVTMSLRAYYLPVSSGCYGKGGRREGRNYFGYHL
jgi:hypothetical protein